MSAARIRSVRFKDGRADLRILYRPDHREVLKRRIAKIMDASPDIAGVAIVVWSADNRSAAMLAVDGSSKIPTMMVPTFVKNRLMTERILEFTLEALDDD